MKNIDDINQTVIRQLIELKNISRDSVVDTLLLRINPEFYSMIICDLLNDNTQEVEVKGL